MAPFLIFGNTYVYREVYTYRNIRVSLPYGKYKVEYKLNGKTYTEKIIGRLPLRKIDYLSDPMKDSEE